jgi:hypothetical protein
LLHEGLNQNSGVRRDRLLDNCLVKIYPWELIQMKQKRNCWAIARKHCFLCHLPHTVTIYLWQRMHGSLHVVGLNISIVTLWVIGGDSETVKHDHESHGSWKWGWLLWWGPAAVVNYRPVISSGRAPHINTATTIWL